MGGLGFSAHRLLKVSECLESLYVGRLGSPGPRCPCGPAGAPGSRLAHLLFPRPQPSSRVHLRSSLGALPAGNQPGERRRARLPGGELLEAHSDVSLRLGTWGCARSTVQKFPSERYLPRSSLIGLGTNDLLLNTRPAHKTCKDDATKKKKNILKIGLRFLVLGKQHRGRRVRLPRPGVGGTRPQQPRRPLRSSRPHPAPARPRRPFLQPGGRHHHSIENKGSFAFSSSPSP